MSLLLAESVLNQQGAGSGGGGGALSYSFLQGAESTTDLTTYTFSAQNLGAAAADRSIVVAVHARGIPNATSCTVTIGGVAATVDRFRENGTNDAVVIARALVPTGATGDIVVTWNAVQLRCSVAAWRVVGGELALSSSASYINFSTSPRSLALSPTSDDGMIVAVAGLGAASGSFAWTGATERIDKQVGSESAIFSVADAVSTAIDDTVGVTCSVGGDNIAAAVAYRAAGGGLEAAILAHNPLHYWKLDEASGSTFADSGSSPTAMTLANGSANYSQTISGTIVGVSSSSDLRLTSSWPTPAGSWTVLAVGDGYAASGAGETVFGYWGGGTSTNRMIVRDSGTTGFDIFVTAGTTQYGPLNCSATLADPWLVAVTFDGSTYRTFGNGTAGATASTSSLLVTAANEWWMHNRGGTTSSGSVTTPIAHHAIIEGSALSSAQLTAIYDALVAGSP